MVEDREKEREAMGTSPTPQKIGLKEGSIFLRILDACLATDATMLSIHIT